MSDRFNPATRSIALFGTSPGSELRQAFIDACREAQVPLSFIAAGDGPPGAVIEANIEIAQAFRCDRVLAFAIDGAAAGTAALAMIGFAATCVAGTGRYLMAWIAEPDLEVLADADVRRDALWARVLVRSHIERVREPNVRALGSLDELIRESIRLADAPG